MESANAKVTLILSSTRARRMRKPQPHAGPQEVQVRKSGKLLADEKVLNTGWEE